MFYGNPGEGKTSLAAQFPAPLFVITSGEQGIYHLKKGGVVPADVPVLQLDPLYDEDQIPAGEGHTGWMKLISTLDIFASGKHDRKTLVIDTCSGLEPLCLQHCASIHFAGDMKSRDRGSWNDYHSGPRKAATAYWQAQFINTCLRAKMAGLDIIVLAHSTSREQKNLEGTDFEMTIPQLSKGFWELIQKDLSDVMFLGRHVNQMIDPKTKDKLVTSIDRFVGVCQSTWYTAKNWENRRDEIEAGNSPQETYKRLMEVL